MFITIQITLKNKTNYYSILFNFGLKYLLPEPNSSLNFNFTIKLKVLGIKLKGV
jgi:hypothetical protein